MVDSSLLNGATADTIEVFRNGTRVADCDPAQSGKASPDPCVIAAPLPDGEDDLLLTVYTSDASKWNIGKKNDANTQELYNGFKGFLSPVDNPKTLNTGKAGSAVPVKFSRLTLCGGGRRGLSCPGRHSRLWSRSPCRSVTMRS